MSRLARGPRFRDGRLTIGLAIGPAGRGAAMSAVAVVILLRLVRRFVACLAVRRCLAALRGRGRPEACPGLQPRAPWSGWAWAGMEGAWPAAGRGWPGSRRAWPGCARPRSGPGSPGPSAASRPARAGPGMAVPRQRAMARRMVRAFGPRPDSRDGRGPAGVGFAAGAVADGVGLVALGAVGVVVANAVPAVGTAPTSGVGAGAERPYPSATVARTRLTTPRASTSRRRCVPLTWILGSPNATGGRRPAAPWATMVAPVRRRPTARPGQPSIATSIGS